MAVTVMGYSEVAMLYKQTQKLCDALGFTSIQEMRNFIDGPRFRPLFQQYAEMCIYPQQKRAFQAGVSRGRGLTMETIEKRMLAGERPGSTKYSEAVPDKSTWDSADYCAFMIYHLKKDNLKNVNGLFYNKGLNDAQILDRLWGLVKHEEWKHAPSQQNKRKDPPKGSQPSAEQPAQPTAGPSQQSGQPTAEPGLDMSGIETVDMTTGDTEDEFMDIDAFTETVSSFGTEITFKDVPGDDSRRPQTIEEELEEDMQELSLGSAVTLTNAERMREENDCPTPNLQYRFWQCWLIDSLIEARNDVGAMRQAINYVSNLDRVANAESQDWMKEMVHRISEDSIIFQPHTEESAKAFDIQQEYFDNVEYQREDLAGACAVLGIVWKNEDTVYRMPGMALSQTLQYWQPVATKALIDFYMDPHIRGCVLGDVMGLGKTWVVVCYLLWVCNVIACQMVLSCLMPRICRSLSQTINTLEPFRRPSIYLNPFANNCLIDGAMATKAACERTC